MRTDQRAPVRTTSFGEGYDLSMIDRFGTWLSERAIRRVLGRSSDRVLGDIGCGYEARFGMSRYASAQRLVLADVSIDPRLVVLDRVTSVIGTLPDSLAQIGTGSIDDLVLNSVLEHLDDPGATLVELRRILRDERGVLFVNVPSWLGKRARELSAFKLGTSPAGEIEDHRRYYDAHQLWQQLRDAGFLPSQISVRTHKFGLNVYGVCRLSSAARAR